MFDLPPGDSGCKYYEDCFTCPFDDCRFDVREPMKKNRNKYIVSLFEQEHLQAVEIAKEAGCDRRTVLRVLAAHRKGKL